MLKITIGVTVYNRFDYVKKMCISLKHSVGLEQCSIRIYDDCSYEFGIEELKNEFPFISEFVRRPYNLGSDLNIQRMYRDFLETGDDVLVNCDSDMIFHEEWINKIRDLLPYTDGVLSGYNSIQHLPVEYLIINNEPMVRKDTIGSAGTVFTRDVVQRIVNNVKPSYKYDWDWSKYLATIGVRLLVTERTYIQHIGLVGQNCDAAQIIDYGLKFFPSNQDTLRLNIAFFEHAIQANLDAVEQKNKYYYFKFRFPKYKILQWVIEPLIVLKNKIR